MVGQLVHVAALANLEPGHSGVAREVGVGFVRAVAQVLAHVSGSDDQAQGVLRAVEGTELVGRRHTVQVQRAAFYNVAVHLAALAVPGGRGEGLPHSTPVEADLGLHVVLHVGRGELGHDILLIGQLRAFGLAPGARIRALDAFVVGLAGGGLEVLEHLLVVDVGNLDAVDAQNALEITLALRVAHVGFQGLRVARACGVAGVNAAEGRVGFEVIYAQKYLALSGV